MVAERAVGHVAPLAGLVALALAVPGLAQEPPEPWKDAKDADAAPLEYRGPGRELPDPSVDEVRLGWFGPGDPDHPRGGDFWRGAVLALESENAAGGYRDIPFRLVARWSDSAWVSGGVEVSRLAYDDEVWAIAGGLDAATAHLAEQVAFKARVVLLSPGSTDVTANLAPVPWFFSCLPSDVVLAPRLAEAIAAASGDGGFAIASAAEHDAHATLAALHSALEARRLSPELVLEFDVVEGDAGPTATRLRRAGATTLVVLGPPTPAARLVRALRNGGFAGRIVGGPALALAAFRRAAGAAAAEGIVVPLLRQPAADWEAFAAAFEERWHAHPDHAAAQSYDVVRLLAAAVRRAGLNRARIRDALRELSPWTGAAGVVDWDALGRNRRPVGLATWRAGRLVPLPTPEQ